MMEKVPESMFIRNLIDCEEFIAGDGSILRELVHADKHPLAISYSLARAVVKPEQTTKLHSLKNSSELYFIMEGEGLMFIDDEREKVRPGQAIYIPPGSSQSIENTGTTDLVFLCIVDPAWRVEDEEVQQGG
jgi:mannose-6-phosphate isomerase-like protein (cupin superfamily)